MDVRDLTVDEPAGRLIGVEILGVSLAGRPSGVRTARLRLHRADGTSRDVEVTFGQAPVYETLVADVAALDAALRARG